MHTVQSIKFSLSRESMKNEQTILSWETSHFLSHPSDQNLYTGKLLFTIELKGLQNIIAYASSLHCAILMLG